MKHYQPQVRPRQLGEQVAYMKNKFPQFSSKFSSPSSIKVKGQLRPSARSCSYEFVLKYDLSGIPNIRITAPKLKLNAKGEKIPHLYSTGDLCLYRPIYNEFKTTDFLADTIIPWTSLWLYYYELWHITGDWLGGGEHPF